MKLEQTDATRVHQKFSLDFETLPAKPETGKPVILKFLPKQADGKPVTEVSIVHEMPMHLMVMSRDLTIFEHVHPEHKSDGSFVLPYRFAKEGQYVLWAEFTPSTGTTQRVRLTADVGHKSIPKAALTPSKIFTAEGFSYQLSTNGPVEAGKPATLTVSIRKGTESVTNIENYLAALGHMAIVSEDTKLFIHAHPDEHSHIGADATATHAHGPDVSFKTMLEQPGLYKVYAQFNIDGKVRTAEFVLPVQGATQSRS